MFTLAIGLSRCFTTALTAGLIFIFSSFWPRVWGLMTKVRPGCSFFWGQVYMRLTSVTDVTDVQTPRYLKLSFTYIPLHGGPSESLLRQR